MERFSAASESRPSGPLHDRRHRRRSRVVAIAGLVLISAALLRLLPRPEWREDLRTAYAAAAGEQAFQVLIEVLTEDR